MLCEPVEITDEVIAAGVTALTDLTALTALAGGHLKHHEDRMPGILEVVLRASYAAATSERRVEPRAA